MMQKAVFGVFAVLLAAPLFLSGCSADSAATGPLVRSASAAPTPTVSAEQFTYEGVDGETVLDLLISATNGNAEIEGSGETAFVTTINGRAAAPSSEFWALYVNGEFAMVGAGSYVTQDGDDIQWRLEEF